MGLVGWRDLRLQGTKEEECRAVSSPQGSTPREGTTPGMGSGSGWGRFSVNLRFVEGKRLDLLMDFEIGHLGPILQMFPPLPNCVLPHPRSHPSLHSCSYLSHKHCPAPGYSTECGAGPHGAPTILRGKDLKQIPGGLPWRSSH